MEYGRKMVVYVLERTSLIILIKSSFIISPKLEKISNIYKHENALTNYDIFIQWSSMNQNKYINKLLLYAVMDESHKYISAKKHIKE